MRLSEKTIAEKALAFAWEILTFPPLQTSVGT